MKRFLPAAILLSLLHFLASLAFAQDEARAVWQLTNFDISANVLQPERALAVVSVLTIKNIGSAAGSGFTVRINSKAVVGGVTANGGTVNYRALAEPRGYMQRVTLTIPAGVAAGATVNV